MKKRIISLALSLVLALGAVMPASLVPAYAASFSRGFELLAYLPAELALGFPLHAVGRGVGERIIIADPTYQRIRQTTADIIRGKSSDYDKAKAICDWLDRNIKYDFDLFYGRIERSRDAFTVFDYKTSTCTGFTNLSMLMLYFAGIPGVSISGLSNPSGYSGVPAPHTWSAAFIDGKWMYFDATWGRFDIRYNFHTSVDIIMFRDGEYNMSRTERDNGFHISRLVGNYSVSRGSNSNGWDITYGAPDDVTELVIPNIDDLNGVLAKYATNLQSLEYSWGRNVRKIVVTPDADKINGNYSVTGSVSSEVFPNLIEVEFMHGITEIPNGTISLIRHLSKVTIPNTVTSIGKWAFEHEIFDSPLLRGGELFTRSRDGTMRFVGGDPSNQGIFGYAGSYAETYARENRFLFHALAPAAPEAPASSGISVTLNGAQIQFDQPPIMEGGRTLVPLRAIFEALGATVTWDGSTQTAAAVRDNITVTVQIGSDRLTRNGQNITLDVPAQMVNNRTLVPARAVAEAFGATVNWDGTTQTVIITN